MDKKTASFEYQHSTNLGDEIQTIAAIHALKKCGLELGELVDRKQVNTTKSIRLLVNGFFEVSELPNLLKKNVTPLFSNIHINCPDGNMDARLMQSFKAYEPIGCRDKWTQQIFQRYGVEAFFNYCMTLTLDRRDQSIKGDRVFMVDVDCYLPLPKHIRQEKIEYLTHHSGNIYCHETKMRLAEELLEKYRTQAKLVITSRLHCALPCIAMGIPVVFFADKDDKRLQLVEEFIPIHSYYNISTPLQEYVKSRRRHPVFLYIKMAIIIMRRIICDMRLLCRNKHQVNWNPVPQDIEKIKQSILDNLRKLSAK